MTPTTQPQPLTVYVVTFRPADGTGVGGFEWRYHISNARAFIEYHLEHHADTDIITYQPVMLPAPLSVGQEDEITAYIDDEWGQGRIV